MEIGKCVAVELGEVAASVCHFESEELRIHVDPPGAAVRRALGTVGRHRVEIHQPVLRVQDEHGVVDRPDHRIPRDRHHVEEPEAEQAAGDQHVAHGAGAAGR